MTNRPYPREFDDLARIQHWGNLRDGLAKEWGAHQLAGVYLLVYKGQVRYIGQAMNLGVRLGTYLKPWATDRPPIRNIMAEHWVVPTAKTTWVGVDGKPRPVYRQIDILAHHVSWIPWDLVKQWVSDEVHVYVALTSPANLDMLERAYIRMAMNRGIRLWNTIGYVSRAPFEVAL